MNKHDSNTMMFIAFCILMVFALFTMRGCIEDEMRENTINVMIEKGQCQEVINFLSRSKEDK